MPVLRSAEDAGREVQRLRDLCVILRRALLYAVAPLLLAPPAPATAAERGTIAGYVVNETTGRRQEGVRVTLVGGRADGSGRVERTATTDGRGRYRFGRLPAGDDRFYVVDALYRGGIFPGSPVSLPATGERAPLITTRIKVWETTSDPRIILVARDNLFLTPGEGTVDVIESVAIANMTKRAYVGRRGRPGAPTLSLPLPPAARGGGVEIVDSDLDVPELVATDTGASLTIAVPPGEWRFTYAYRVPGSAGSYDLSRTANYPVVQTAVHATEEIDVASNRLVENGEVTVGGTVYRRWSSTEAIDEGSPLQMNATVEGNPAGGGTALGAAAAVAAVLLAATLWRTQQARRRRTQPASSGPGREELLQEIAALDIRHDAGAVGDEEWRAQRDELLARVRSEVPEAAR